MPSENSTTECVRSYQTGSVEARLKLLAGLSPELRAGLIEEALVWLEQETEPTLVAALIQVFGDGIPKEKITLVSGKLFDSSLSVRLAALGVLSRRAPSSLVQYLPKLLGSEEPRMRILAIQGLADIDPDEAVSHLEILLLGKTAEEKRAGIQGSFFLPFEQVKVLALRFLAIEEDRQLLEQAGMLFTSNPDLEIPFRLWAIAGKSAPDKAAVLKTLVKGICAALEGSGVLGEDFPRYREKLQAWIQKREAMRFVQGVVERLSQGPEGCTPDLEAAILKGLTRPLIRDAFQEALEWPLESPVKLRLKEVLGPESKPATESLPETEKHSRPGSGSNLTSASRPETPRSETPSMAFSGDTPPRGDTDISKKTARPDFPSTGDLISPEQFLALSADERIRALVALEAGPGDVVRPLLQEILGKGRFSEEETASALRVARSLKIPDFKEKAGDAVRNNNANLATAALEYLTEFDADRGFSYLGKFLQSPVMRMKSTAIRLLQKSDLGQALSRLTSMLLSKEAGQQHSALGCMVYFDFSVVQPLLVRFLEGTTDMRLFQAGLCLFQANPAPELLYQLFRIEKLVPGEMSSLAFSTRRKMEHLLADLGIFEPAEDQKKSDEKLEIQWKEEQKKLDKPSTPYSVKKLQAQGKLPVSALQAKMAAPVAMGVDALGNVLGFFIRHSLTIMGVVGLILAFQVLTFVKSIFNVEKDRIAIGAPLEINGIVQKRLSVSGKMEVRTEHLGVFEIATEEKFYSTFKKGDSFKAIVIPTKTMFGVTSAEIQSQPHEAGEKKQHAYPVVSAYFSGKLPLFMLL